MADENKTVKFKGKVVRTIWSNNSDFWIYALDVNRIEYPNIVRNKYGNVTISGNLGDLSYMVDYEIVAIPVNDKYGISYSVSSMRRDVPTDIYDVKLFLEEILTYNQATVLLEHYPDIIERVRKQKLDDIDLSQRNQAENL